MIKLGRIWKVSVDVAERRKKRFNGKSRCRRGRRWDLRALLMDGKFKQREPKSNTESADK